MADNGSAQPQEGEGVQKEPQGTDWKAEARKWERRAKENLEKAQAWDEKQEADKTELQKAQDKAAKAEAQVKELRAAAKKSELKAKVAKATGVPAELIVGDDEEAMTEFAQAVAKYAKPEPAPKAGKPGSFSNNAKGDSAIAAKRELASQMFGAKD